ncbi:MAG: DNA-binding protein [Deltaproteobacteria bacterium]|nr:DNA-binding protein [Deltaproteobacteria bacterium]
MTVKELYLAWEDPIDRKWLPVGLLTIDDNNIYRFVYTKGAESSRNFVPLARMDQLDKVYTSETLFPLFSNRLLSASRPEYENYMEWLDVNKNEYDPLTVLAITEGIRGTDTFEVFPCPKPNDEGQYAVKFLSRGLRYLSEYVIERINNLQKGDRLFIMPDIQNSYDPMALALRTDDPVEMVGYCPRYLSSDFYELLEKTRTIDIEVSVERINVDAPFRLRLLCKIVAPWPEGFKPCSAEEFKPLAGYDYELKPLQKLRPL